MPFVKDSIRIKYNETIIKHELKESYRLQIALLHYYLGNNSKRHLAKIYDINLNSFKVAWYNSNYPKKIKKEK